MLRVIRGGKDASFYMVELRILERNEDGVTSTPLVEEVYSGPEFELCRRLVQEMMGHAEELRESGWVDADPDATLETGE